MAIYRGEGGKTDVVPADGDQEFAGSIIAEKDIHAHGNISADGDITVGGDLYWEGTINGDASGLENIPTPFLQADDCIYLNNQVITNDYTMPVGKNGMTAGDVTVNGELTIPDGSDWHIVGMEDGIVSLDTLGIPNHDLVTVDETGQVTVQGITSQSPYEGDGSNLTGIIHNDEFDDLESQVIKNSTDIQANADAIAAIPGAVDAYTKAEIDSQQSAQDTKINKNTADIALKASQSTTYTKDEVDASQATQDAEIDKKLEDAPTDGEQYVRKNGVWAELVAEDGGLLDAPADGKTYGRRDYRWQEIVSDAYTQTETDALLNDKADKADTYTKDEIDAQQLLQDAEITANTSDIADNVTDIKKNADDIEELQDDVDALTGSIIYKGSLNATVDSPPADANLGDMWINEYNADEPATNYPVASGWAPVTEVKFMDKLIKTDTEWDKIESVVGVGVYTSGEVDELLDDKADKTDVYTKTQTDTLLDNKANVGDSYTKAETYSNVEVDSKLFEKADKTTTYTKTEVDSSQALQNTEIAKKADKATTYTKDEVDELLTSATGAIVGNYTNKHASSVARDPGEGNLYLIDGTNFTTKFEDVTRIYISDIDGDGALRDFDSVNAGDEITITSDDGQGEYKVLSVSDLTGYRELVVDSESASGTVANDSPVTLILDIDASGDNLWTEVDGVAVYDGDIKVNGITVGKGAGNKGSNTAVGVDALAKNTTGDRNTALGYQSLNNNKEGVFNVAVGHQAQIEATGSRNVSVGIASLKLSEGEFNTAIGHTAGDTLTTGRNNTLIGANATPSAPDVSNEVTIGDDQVTKTRLKGRVYIPTTLPTTALPVNTHIADNGAIYKSTATSYSSSEIDTKLAGKEDKGVAYPKSETYTKTEVNTELAKKANTGVSYTKAEADAKLAGKANNGVSYTKAETYTKAEVNTELGKKEAKGYGYSKAETDSKLNGKANNGVSYTKAEADAKLAGKEAKGYGYSKAEIDALLTPPTYNLWRSQQRVQQTLTSSWDAISYEDVFVDPIGDWDGTTWTAPKTGHYHVDAAVGLDNHSGAGQIAIYRDSGEGFKQYRKGTSLKSESSGATGPIISTLIYAEKGNTVQIRAYNTKSGIKTIASPAKTHVNIREILYSFAGNTPDSVDRIKEIDVELDVKDKLIEKLSARLDKLEKRIK